MAIGTPGTVLRTRRTKIVATLGPASRSEAVLAELVDAGVDVFRLNFSHGDHDHHRETYERVRAAARRRGREVAVLADLSGPKIGVGSFPGGSVVLVAGGRVTVTTRDVLGEPALIPSRYRELAGDVRPGESILLDDGNLELRIEGIEGSEIACTVVHGGILRDRKGMNLPGTRLSAPSLTAKDREDALFALGLGVDFLALSFVRRASDVTELQQLVEGEGSRAAIVAKIETPQALAEIEAIVLAAGAIMIARGDLGVELPPERVPLIQDQLVDLARSLGKPSIIATQMLESMNTQARPTRAEVSDVAHAVATGADAVMLSAETASGAHPVLAVRMMDRVARETEGHLFSDGAFGSLLDGRRAPPPLPVPEAVGRATAELSRDLRVRAIVVATSTGFTARMVAAARPAAPVAAVSADSLVCRQMRLLWGVIPHLAESDEAAEPEPLARRLAVDFELARPDDHILLVRGFHKDSERNAPSITVLTV